MIVSGEPRLGDVHPDLQRLMREVGRFWDIAIIETLRTKERQAQLFQSGASKTMSSKHLAQQADGLAWAVDVAPLPLDWNDIKRFYYFGGFVLGLAKELGLPIIWGGDWNGNTQVKDQGFNDLDHFERVL